MHPARPPPTREARLDRAKALLATAIEEIVEATLDMKGEGSGEWVDQATSPLGRRRHCALVRAGKLPACRDGRRVLVRRADIEAYLATKRVVVVNESNDDVREIARIVSDFSRR